MKLSDFDDTARFERVTPDKQRPNSAEFLSPGRPAMTRVYCEKKTRNIWNVSPDPGEYRVLSEDGAMISDWTKLDA